MSVDKRKLKSANAKYQAEVGYWSSFNHLQDYKIYGIVIKTCEQLVTTSYKQPMASTPNEPKSQNVVSLIM
jgi:hypothetical protein